MPVAEDVEIEPIDKVEFDGHGSMTIGSRRYRLRELRSIELRHSLEAGQWNVINVYVGTTDHSDRNAFSQAALKREPVGVVDSAEVVRQIRKTAAEIDLPVLEY
jgi:hypothetical protein